MARKNKTPLNKLKYHRIFNEGTSDLHKLFDRMFQGKYANVRRANLIR